LVVVGLSEVVVNRTRALVVLTASFAVTSALTALSPASATLAGPPKVRASFDDTPCGVPVHAEITGSNPVVYTGKVLAGGDVVTVNTGHVVQRLTAADGRWMEDDFSGPAKLVSAAHLADGTANYRVAFDGIREQFKAWNGDVVADKGHLVADYVFAPDGSMVSRTVVSETGAFPIINGQVDFCGFLTAHLG
jgi:hypothetical protein